MDILFGSKNLEQLCHDESLATRTLGRVCAQKLRARLDDLRAIVSLAYAPNLPGRFQPLPGNSGCFALQLHSGKRLVIKPTHFQSLRRAEDPSNLSDVKSICVMRIETDNV
jgi:proteic killer suppression protein